MGQQKQKTKARRPRGTGSVYRPAKSRFLWIKYSKHGKPYRESTGTTDQRKAANLLQSRLAEIATGAFVGPVTERVKVQELAEDFLRATTASTSARASTM